MFLNSPYSRQFLVQFLSKPTNLAIANGTITWNQVAGALKYRVDDSTTGESVVVTTNSYSGFTEGGSHNISVTAVGDGSLIMDSQSSDSISFATLTAPQNLEYDVASNTVKWSSTYGAKGYTLKLDDGYSPKEIDIGTGITSYNLGVLSTKPTKISIKAEAGPDQNSLFDSSYTDYIGIQKLSPVDPKTITVKDSSSGDTGDFSFKPVEHASKYKVSINSKEILETGSSFTYQFPDNINNISIVAVAPTSKTKGSDNHYWYYGDSDTATFDFTKLTAPTNLHLDGDKLVWNAVNMASKYEISVNGNNYSTSDNYYDCSSIGSEGTNNVIVRAKGDGVGTLSSSFSTSFTFNKLSAPSGFKRTGYILSWNPVNGCTGYNLYINDNKPQSLTTNSVSLQAYFATQDVIQAQVSAAGNSDLNTVTSNKSTIFQISRLSTPSNVKVSPSGIATWNRVSNASSYILTLNDESIKVSGTSYDITSKVDGGVAYSLSVTAATDSSNYINSLDSNTVVGKRLSKPTNLRIENNKLAWDSVQSAMRYRIILNGESFYSSASETTYSAIVTSARNDNSFTVQALSTLDNASTSTMYFDSPVSDPCKFVSTKLTAPVDFTITKGVDSSGTKCLHISFKAVPDAVSYVLLIGGIRNYLTGTTYDYTYQTPGIFDMQVIAIGNGLTVLDSLPSQNYSANLLYQPTIDGPHKVSNTTSRYQIVWNSIDGVSSYTVKVVTTIPADSSTSGSTSQTTEDNIQISSNQCFYEFDVTKGYQYVLSVKANGNGLSSFDSDWSTQVTLAI
jgi:hypothetical protein